MRTLTHARTHILTFRPHRSPNFTRFILRSGSDDDDAATAKRTTRGDKEGAVVNEDGAETQERAEHQVLFFVYIVMCFLLICVVIFLLCV
jgi:hypothetical protein